MYFSALLESDLDCADIENDRYSRCPIIFFTNLYIDIYEYIHNMTFSKFSGLGVCVFICLSVCVS